MRISSRSFANITSSTCIGDSVITNATYDSRKVKEGSLFIAVKGKNRDGHEFAIDASQKGAAAVLISKDRKERIVPFVKKGCAVILTDDPLTTFQDYAARVAYDSGAKMIAVTGSCGKTTTKDMLASILSQVGSCAKTPGNQNSIYGLPLSLMELEKGTEFGVFELGTDNIGEMEIMTDIIQPESACITNIGISHLSSFKTRENIAREKGNIFLPGTRGYVLKDNQFNSYFKGVCDNLNECSMPFDDVEFKGLEGFILTLGKERFSLPMVGGHNLKDATLAVAIARSYGATDRQIAEGLSTITPEFGRSRVVKEGEVTVLEDCYNATYDSVEDAIKTVSSLDWNGRKHIVLGDMRELGSESKNAHRKIGEELLKADCRNIYLYGEEIEECYDVLRSAGRDCLYTRSFDDLSKEVRRDTNKGDLLLLKGSRVMEMERIYSALRRVV
ncbi:MAG: UDP-N-acetylmuramoyl-tripeptide--D-alanyl-D-alanine ligase [Sphaerochaetaceae bacterium]|nr:UDP-N-acetylmuramoyl-tripeptide--D-alanyl-D-alanine ligase [Sphaerochaetaceae bacterium]